MGDVCERKHEYDLNGKVIKLDIPNYYTQENKYDVLGRLVEMGSKGFKGLSSSAFSFRYNDLTQLISEKNQETTTYAYDSLDNRIKINDEQMVFDALNQLKVNGNTSYSYDEQGNLLSRKINRYILNIRNNVLSETRQFLKADKKKLFCLYDALGRRVMKNYMEPLNN